MFVGSFRWHGHDLREAGFRSYIREYAPDFQMLDTLVNLDAKSVTKESVHALLRQHPDLEGIYIAGGGMEGAIEALREIGPEHLPAVVVNELTPVSAAALQDHVIVGAVATPLPTLCRTVVDMMIGAKLNGLSDHPGQAFLPFNLHVPESL